MKRNLIVFAAGWIAGWKFSVVAAAGPPWFTVCLLLLAGVVVGWVLRLLWTGP